MSRRTKWLTSAWIPHRLELRVSPSWSMAPVPLRRILERLENEHMRHGGQNNGALFVSFSQIVECGVSRRNIAPCLALGESLGLIEVIRPDSITGDIRAPNAYRLTYLPTKSVAPTDEWKAVSRQDAEACIRTFNFGDRGRREAVARRVA